jgi:hypothetical protein
LDKFVVNLFPGAYHAGDDEESYKILTKLVHTLTACNLHRYTDIKVVGTNDLFKHLRFEEDLHFLSVFPHKQLLIDILKSREGLSGDEQL